MQGWEFARAFLFETPFALMRMTPYLLAGGCVVFAILIAYQAVLYRRTLRRAQH